MSVVNTVVKGLFGNGRNVIAETAGVFRINREADAQRQSDMRAASLDQFSHEFRVQNRGGFDRFMDGLNRIPRPAMAFGTLGLFISAMVDPVWFAERMVGLAVVPDPLWWLLGAIVSFYFGARYQAKGQEFRRDVARSASAIPSIEPSQPKAADAEEQFGDNPALKAWKAAS